MKWAHSVRLMISVLSGVGGERERERVGARGGGGNFGRG